MVRNDCPAGHYTKIIIPGDKSISAGEIARLLRTATPQQEPDGPQPRRERAIVAFFMFFIGYSGNVRYFC